MSLFRRSAALWVGLLAFAPAIRSARADRAMARALVEQGVRLDRDGEARGALQALEQAIAEDPDYLPAYDAAIEMWMRAGRFDVIIDRLQRVTLRQPRYAPAWYALAFAYRRLERNELAVLCYREYIDLRFDDPDPWFGLGMSYLELGDREHAVAALARYLELERRPDRGEFRARARVELTRLQPAAAIAADPLAMIRDVGEQLRALACAGRDLLLR